MAGQEKSPDNSVKEEDPHHPHQHDDHHLHEENQDDHQLLISKKELWKNAFEKEVDDGVNVQLDGLESRKHTVFARVVSSSKDDSLLDKKVTIGQVLECLVDEEWRRLVKEILEQHHHIETDSESYPSAHQLLELGSVWLLNETTYTHGQGAHAHRLNRVDQSKAPNWNDMTLRVHYMPDRFHVANTVDWAKYCRALLVGRHKIDVSIHGEIPHLPIATETELLPDAMDGVIVYEDAKLGFAVINKPGGMPVHATLSNHAEDAVSLFRKALQDRHKKTKAYAMVPQRNDASLDMETHGLLVVATNVDFAVYWTKLLDQQQQNHSTKTDSPAGLARKYRCLVCVKDPDSMDRLEAFQSKGTIVTHYVDAAKSSKRVFVRHKPMTTTTNNDDQHHWQECRLRITNVGHEKFRAACVRTKYKDSMDSNLAHWLWGPDDDSMNEVQYVMEIEGVAMTARKHQIRGQLAALGFPIVGDVLYGGGKCDIHSNHHVWQRMALQCCEVSFKEPEWDNNKDTKGKKKKKLVASEKQCTFRLNDAWWSEYLEQYEEYHQSGQNLLSTLKI